MSDPLEVTFQAIAEDQPGEKWLACCERTSPKWREWYQRNSPDGLPTVTECRQALSWHMPKWRPYMTGCVRLSTMTSSQLAYSVGGNHRPCSAGVACWR